MLSASSSLAFSDKSTARIQPLSDEELDILDASLEALIVLADGDDVDMSLPLSLASADGLFSALALSPRSTSIADWMRLVMAGIAFEDKTRTQECRNLLIRHYHSVVHQLRKTDMEQFYPCVTYYETSDENVDCSDDCIDVRGWCAGFALGYELQKEAWDACLDEMALSDLNLLLAFKDIDASGLVDEDESEAEYALRDAQVALIALMREEISVLLQEPADDLSMLLFALQGLQSAMLAPPSSLDSQKSIHRKTQKDRHNGDKKGSSMKNSGFKSSHKKSDRKS